MSRGESSRRFRLRLAGGLRRVSRRLKLTRVLRSLGATRWVEESLLADVFSDPSTTVDVETYGFDLNVPGTSVQSYLHDRYEPLSCARLAQWAPHASGFIDVGAHIGLTTLVVAGAIRPERGIIAVEPNPPVRDILVENLRRNGFAGVQVTAAALGAEVGSGVLTATRNSQEASLALVADEESTRVEVAVTTVDRLVEEYGIEADLLKIDVEGWEVDVLEGAQHFLARPNCRLIVEWNPTAQRAANRSPDELLEFLSERFEVVEVLDDQREERYPLSRLDRGEMAFGDYPRYVNLACSSPRVAPM